MPRVARKISMTKVYHIILRGNDRQDIFFEDQDYKKFLRLIIITKEKYQYEIYAYCLMTNHVHLIIYDKNSQISRIMQSIEISYSNYFAKKYDRNGHLFQNRFISKNVETENYLRRLCRYIHQNPLKAKISITEDYKWSSYNEFIYQSKIISSQLILSMFGQTKKEAVKNFIQFHNDVINEMNEEIEYEGIAKLTDEQLEEKIKRILQLKQIQEIYMLDRNTRNEKICLLKNIQGTSKVQLARVLGMNRKMLERIMKRT